MYYLHSKDNFRILRTIFMKNQNLIKKLKLNEDITLVRNLYKKPKIKYSK